MKRARVPIPKPDPRMSNTEALYAAHLAALKAEGRILRFDFQPESLRLADSTYYRPDFRVVTAEGYVEIHEVKGRRGQSFHAEEDAWLKLKIVAELHPYAVVVVWPLKGGGWGERRLGASA